MRYCQFGYLLIVGGVVSFAAVGCARPSGEKADAKAAHDHDHEGHDHEGHDHGHEGHDHAGHDHGHGEQPKTYAEAVEKVEELRNTIRDSLAAKDNDKADVAVHAIGHVLEALPKLAEEASLGDAEKTEVKSASEKLLDEFGKIDEELHGEKPSTYSERSEQIDAAVEQLHKLVKK